MIGLELCNLVSWWKGIFIKSDPIVQMQESQTPREVKSSINRCLQVENLIYGRRKLTSGIQSDMYAFVDVAQEMKGGNSCDFHWEQD